MREFWPPPAEGPHRDLIGYGRHVPAVRWPGGARVAVSLCLNVEMLSAGEEVELRELEEESYRSVETLGIDLSRPERPDSE